MANIDDTNRIYSIEVKNVETTFTSRAQPVG